MNVSEKVAYIKGLVEGLDLDTNKKEVKVINAMLELLEEMADNMTEIEDAYDELCDRVETLEEDFSDLEDDYYGDYEDIDYDDFDEVEDENKNENTEQFYEVTCPSCNEKINLTEDVVLSGNMSCPSCGEVLELNFSEGSDSDKDNSETTSE